MSFLNLGCSDAKYPDGSLRKLKARISVKGDRQIEGVDYLETIAHSSKLEFSLSNADVFDLATEQVNYTCDFIVRKWITRILIMVFMFICLYVLDNNEKDHNLKNSSYGLKKSSINFFQHLKAKLKLVGFKSQ